MIEMLPVEYKTKRPRSALGYRPLAPATFASQFALSARIIWNPLR